MATRTLSPSLDTAGDLADKTSDVLHLARSTSESCMSIVECLWIVHLRQGRDALHADSEKVICLRSALRRRQPARAA